MNPIKFTNRPAKGREHDECAGRQIKITASYRSPTITWKPKTTTEHREGSGQQAAD